MVTLQTLYQQVKSALEQANFEDASFEARELLKIADLGDVHRTPQVFIAQQQLEKLKNLCERRLKHEPLQYLSGEWDFMDFTVLVGEGVLIPRDDTEVCASLAIQKAKKQKQAKVIDLCSGTGIIGIAIARACPDASVTAVELSEKAFSYLEKNNERFGNRIQLVQADVLQWSQMLAAQSVDIIVSNPPYVTEQEYQTLAPELFYEPKMALTAPENGLLFYRQIASRYYSALKPQGMLIFEIGETQAQQVCDICRQAGYHNITVHQDLEKRPRAICAVK